jgi:transglutaminase-like putative cysteine protease
MRYQISHITTYTYSQPVTLQPHVVRLRPRSDGFQTLQSCSLLVTPSPSRQCHLLDVDGNTLIKLWFPSDTTDRLTVEVLSQVETHLVNPFDYLLEPGAIKLPIDYPASLLVQLQPYLGGQLVYYRAAVDPIAVQLAQEISQQVDGDVLSFLSSLNQRICHACSYTIREMGDPLPAGVTWTTKAGSCRDFAVLFIETCRAIGLAARFVSGYQEGDLDRDERHLHAWAEVFLPGGGWRGYDPTLGLAVADRHIALVASTWSNDAAPISGSFKQTGGVQTVMDYRLTIQRLALETPNGKPVPETENQSSER